MDRQYQKELSIIENLDSKDDYLVFACPAVYPNDNLDNLILQYNVKDSTNMQVKLLRFPKDSYYQSINLMITSGEQIDVFIINSEWLPSYIDNNLLLDLSAYSSYKFLNSAREDTMSVANPTLVNNHQYAIKWHEYTTRLIYNKNLFEKSSLDPNSPPKTLDEFTHFAKIISQTYLGTGIYGFALPAGDSWSAFSLSMEIPSTYSSRYRYDFEKDEYDLSVYKPWLKAFIQMKKDNSLFPGENSLRYDLALAQFAEGNIGMMFAPSWVYAAFEDAYLSADFEVGITLPPLISDDMKPGTLETTPEYIGVNSSSSHISTSLDLLQFLYEGNYPILSTMQDITTPRIQNYFSETDAIMQADTPTFRKTTFEHNYPIPPLNISDQSRFNIYMKIIDGSLDMDTGLINESEKLNEFKKKMIIHSSPR